MAFNVSLSHPTDINLYPQIIHVLVTSFLCIDILLIATFFQKHYFYTTSRYILFSVMLCSDCFVLLMSYMLLLFGANQATFTVWICAIICGTILIYVEVTPVTLTVMTLERYVAICLPLRHGELCSTRNTVRCILLIHGISAVPCLFILSAFFASASVGFYSQNMVCTVEIFILQFKWQEHLRSAIHQSYFLIMITIILFTYVKILKVARVASGENKKSTYRGLKTVTLQAFQLMLCLIRLWCPFIEAAVLHLDIRLFAKIRYFNYVVFALVPRFLSPLVYGLKDEMFLKALKQLVFRGLCVTKR